MNVQDTLYFGLAAYSSIFPNRAACLNHLFCVNGGGYDWIDGQLVSVCEEYPEGTTTMSQKIAYVFDRRRESDRRREEEKTRWEQERKNKPADPEEEAKLDRIIDDALEANRKAREADPEKFDRDAEESERRFQELKAQMDRDAQWEYAVPDNMDERLADTKYNHWYPMSENKWYGTEFYQFTNLLDFPEDIQPDWLDALIETTYLILAQPNEVTRHMDEAGVQRNREIAEKALEAALIRKYGKRVMA